MAPTSWTHLRGLSSVDPTSPIQLLRLNSVDPALWTQSSTALTHLSSSVSPTLPSSIFFTHPQSSSIFLPHLPFFCLLKSCSTLFRAITTCLLNVDCVWVLAWCSVLSASSFVSPTLLIQLPALSTLSGIKTKTKMEKS